MTGPADLAALSVTVRLSVLNIRRNAGGWIVSLTLLSLALAGITGRSQSATTIEQIRLRAANADPEAQNALGNAYTNGQMGIAQDYAEALVWYQRAAEKGFAPAQFNLGLAYELGRGMPADETVAFRYYLKAAEQGFGAALFNVGNMYATGRGVRQDLFEANVWYRQAADKGVTEAQFNLGLAYESGRGVKLDEAQAAQWYRKAADRGFPLAQYNLGLLLEDGRGVPKDDTAAARYYRAAAELGLGSAQNNYGLMLHEGRGGLAKDPVQAMFWLTLAVENGVEPVARDTIARSLNAEQTAEARRLLEARQQNTTGVAASNNAVAKPAGVTSPPAVIAAAAPQLERRTVRETDAPLLVDQLRDQVGRLASQVLDLTAEKHSLEEKLAAAQGSPGGAAPGSDKREAERLSLQLRLAGEQIVRLNREIVTLKSAGQTGNAVDGQVRQLSARISELEQLLRQARIDGATSIPSDGNTAVDRLQQQVRTLQRENRDLERWVQTLEVQVKRESDHQTDGAGAENLAEKLAEAEQMLTATKTALESQIQREEKLKAENSMLVYRFQRAEELLAAQLAGNAKPAELAQLKGELLEAKELLQKLSREKNALANVWAEEQHNLRKAQARVTELEQELGKAWKSLERSVEPGARHPATALNDQTLSSRQIEQLIREHENAHALLTVSKEALGASQQRVTELIEEVERLQRSQAQPQGSPSLPGQRQSPLEREQATTIASLQAENRALSARLSKAQKTIDQIINAVRGDAPEPAQAPAVKPAPEGTPALDRFHVVLEGDSLPRISQQYYGTPDRGTDIYRANSSALQGRSTLPAGVRLLIP